MIKTYTSIGQELKYEEIKDKILTSIEANFPIHFNSNKELKEIFYDKCDEYGTYCQKLRFDRIIDFRIIEIITQEEFEIVNTFDNLPPDYYRIEAHFSFLYKSEKSNHFGNGILDCLIRRIMDGYEIDYIQIVDAKGLQEHCKPVLEREVYILNRLTHTDR